MRRRGQYNVLLGYLVTFFLAIWLFAISPLKAEVDERRAFLAQIAKHLSGSSDVETPIGSAGYGGGWSVYMLAPPGTTLVSLTEGYNGVTADLSRAWSATSVFDRPLEYRNGYGVLSQRSLEAVWDEYLNETMPPLIAPKIAMSRSAAQRWLYDCSKHKLRKPSKFMSAYRKFGELSRVLVAGKDSELWRLHPELKRFRSYESAVDSVNRRWVREGFKDEIDSAIKVIDSEQNTVAWRKWTSMRSSLDLNRIRIDAVRSLAQSIMLPPPGTWGETEIWSRASVEASGQRINFQIARVKILRPWLEIEGLINSASRAYSINNNALPLSDGVVPSSTTFPTGALPAIVDELILVRRIRSEGGGSIDGHPLGNFAYPDAINLLGYVARTLPKS